MRTVEAATVRFESFSTREARIRKSRERRAMRPKPKLNRRVELTMTKIPAMTRVQEWSREETGVGPSMASGSQRYVKKQIDLRERARTKRPKRGPEEVQAEKARTVRTMAKRTSPIRLNPMAEKAELSVKDRFSQVPMRLKLTNPTISQQNRAENNEIEEIKTQTVKRKHPSFRMKLRKVGSNSR